MEIAILILSGINTTAFVGILFAFVRIAGIAKNLKGSMGMFGSKK